MLKGVRTHYEVLGVSRGDSRERIQQAWKKLVRENHPDRNPALHDHVATLNSAWGAFEFICRQNCNISPTNNI
jgi:curved DNA-binding protein CbpA